MLTELLCAGCKKPIDMLDTLVGSPTVGVYYHIRCEPRKGVKGGMRIEVTRD